MKHCFGVNQVVFIYIYSYFNSLPYNKFDVSYPSLMEKEVGKRKRQGERQSNLSFGGKKCFVFFFCQKTLKSLDENAFLSLISVLIIKMRHIPATEARTKTVGEEVSLQEKLLL